MSWLLSVLRENRWKVLLLTALAVGAVRALNAHVDGVNGPTWWRWSWQSLDWRTLLVGFLVSAVPFVVGQYLFAIGAWPARRALRAVAATLLLLQLAAAGSRLAPFSLEVGARVIQSVNSTSFFTDATALAKDGLSLRQLLEGHPKRVAGLHTHTRTKPPGPLLVHLSAIRLFGPGDGAATVLALLIAFVTSLGVFAVAWFIRVVTGDERRGFHGASLYALLPGIVVIHPMFDQILPILTAAMLGCWVLALRTERRSLALLSGAVVAAVCFFTYNLLTLGVFLVGYTVLSLVFEGRKLRSVLEQVGLAVVGFVVPYVALFAAWRFNPWSSLRAALLSEKDFQRAFPRPYPSSVFWDVADYSLGLGWLAVVLAVLGTVRRQPRSERAVAVLCLLQVVVVAATGLLAGETARVFLFLTPLVLVPVDAELGSWRPLQRAVLYLCALVTTAAIARNLLFISF